MFLEQLTGCVMATLPMTPFLSLGGIGEGVASLLTEPGVRRGRREDGFCIRNFGRSNKWYILPAGRQPTSFHTPPGAVSAKWTDDSSTFFTLPKLRASRAIHSKLNAAKSRPGLCLVGGIGCCVLQPAWSVGRARRRACCLLHATRLGDGLRPVW